MSEERLLKIHEVAGILRCDDTTVRRWIKNGVLAAVVLPRVNDRQAYRVRESVIREMLIPRNLGVEA